MRLTLILRCFSDARAHSRGSTSGLRLFYHDVPPFLSWCAHKGLCSHFQPFNTLCLLLPPSPPYSRLLSGHWHAETFSCLTAAWAGLCSHIEQRSLGNVFEKCFKLVRASGGVGGTPRCWVMLYKRYHALFFFVAFFCGLASCGERERKTV